MAPISNLISFIFFATLLLSLQTNARDSQFFSKVTHSSNNDKETELPTTQKSLNKPEELQQQQQPAFIPETTENSYGLYGHDSSQFPSTTTTTTATNPATNFEPYKTEFEDTSMYNNNNKYYYNNDAYNNHQSEFNNNNKYYYNNDAYNNHQSEFNNNNNNYHSNDNYNKDAYGGYQNELSDIKYTEEGSYNNNNNNNNHYNYNNNNYRYNNERQGMSDTRFMENGKYYYDINAEKNYNTMLHGEAYRGINNDNKWYGQGNQGGYHNGNYQNQEEFEEEIDESEP